MEIKSQKEMENQTESTSKEMGSLNTERVETLCSDDREMCRMLITDLTCTNREKFFLMLPQMVSAIVRGWSGKETDLQETLSCLSIISRDLHVLEANRGLLERY